jgi:voltage-gated potassium channel
MSPSDGRCGVQGYGAACGNSRQRVGHSLVTVDGSENQPVLVPPDLAENSPTRLTSAKPRSHTSAASAERKWDERFRLPTLVAALLVIPTVVIEESDLSPAWKLLASVLNWIIWLVFVAQVATMLVLTKHRWRWIRSHPLEVLIVILTPPFLPAGLQSLRILRLLRLLRVAITARSLRFYFSISGLKFATLIAIFGVLGAGALYAAVEPQHMSTWDGVWWAINTVTTAGSYYSPQTTTGRAITIAVLVVGVGYIAVLTGAIAQLFIRAMHAEVNAEADLGRRIDALSTEIASLREAIQGRQP